MKKLKIGDNVRTRNIEVQNALDKRGGNSFKIQYFRDNNKRCYLTSNKEKGWMIEKVTNLELI